MCGMDMMFTPGDFDQKLINALSSLNAANANVRQDAINKLQAFINDCQAQSGKQLTVAQANELIADARDIITDLQAGY